MASDFPRGWHLESDFLANFTPSFTIPGVVGITSILTDFVYVIGLDSTATVTDSGLYVVEITTSDGKFTNHKIGYGWISGVSPAGSTIEISGSGEWRGGPGSDLTVVGTHGSSSTHVFEALAIKGRDI